LGVLRKSDEPKTAENISPSSLFLSFEKSFKLVFVGMQKSGMLLRQIVQGPGLALARRSLATATAGPGHTGNKSSSSTGFFSSFFEPRQIQVRPVADPTKLGFFANEEFLRFSLLS